MASDNELKRVVGLDIGTNKVAAIVAEVTPEREIEIITKIASQYCKSRDSEGWDREGLADEIMSQAAPPAVVLLERIGLALVPQHAAHRAAARVEAAEHRPVQRSAPLALARGTPLLEARSAQRAGDQSHGN